MADYIPNLPMTFDGQVANAQRMNYQDRAIGMFFLHPEINTVESRKVGRPVYDDVAFVKIIQPGEKDTVERPAKPEDKHRFERAWRAFEAKQIHKVDGTTITALFPHNPGVVKTLDALSITTVEQLAALNDTQLQNIGLGAREWHAMASRFIGATEKGKGFHELQARIDSQDAENKRLADIIAKLEEKMADTEDKPRRGNSAKN